MSTDTNKIETVIRGSMAKWKKENSNAYSRGYRCAEQINKDLQSIIGGDWNIIIYPKNSYDSEKGYPSFVVVDDDYVYYQRRQNIFFDFGYIAGASKLREFLEKMFGWAKVTSPDAFHRSIKDALEGKYGANAQGVLVRKPRNSSISSCISGTHWSHDGYDVWVWNEYVEGHF